MGDQFREQKDKDHLNLLFNQQITAPRRMIKLIVLILLVTSTATSAGKKKSGKLAARIDALEKQMKSVGISLGSLCQVVDTIGAASATPFDCCSNAENMQTRCELRSVNMMEMFGISWNEAVPGMCVSTDAQCSVADGF